MESKVKYRRLTLEELHLLEKEFVDFLVVNGVGAEDWEKLKAEDKPVAERMLDLFSDVVMEGTLRKIQFLEFYSVQEVMTFQCLNEKIILIGLEGPQGLDLSNSTTLQEVLKNPPEGVKVFRSEKSYLQSREEELFQMIQKGAVISDGLLFKSLLVTMG